MEVLILSEIPVWNISKGSGIRVISETIHGFNLHGWKTELICPGIANMPAPPNAKILAIKLLGAIYMFLWRKGFVKRSEIMLDKLFKIKQFKMIYAIGPTSHFIANKLKCRHPFVIVVARYLGTWSMYSKMNNKFYQLKKTYIINNYTLPADLYVLTDDGTRALDVFTRFGVNSNKILFIKNGVDIDSFTNAEADRTIVTKQNIHEEDFLILIVTRLAKGKNVEQVIKSIRKFLVNHCSSLIIIGDGPERKRIERLVRHYKLNEKVKILGALPHSELAKYYKIADIVISAYNYSNAGNPLLEAIASGTCVIAFNNGDTKKFLPDSYDLLIDDMNFQMIAEYLNELYFNRERLKRNKKLIEEHAKELLVNWDDRIEREIVEIEKTISNIRELDKT